MQLVAKPKGVAICQLEIEFGGVAEIPSVGVHRHKHGHWESGFVMADVHRVPGVLPEHICVENAAVEVSAVMQVERFGVVAHQVHLRVDKALVWRVMQTGLEDGEVARALCGQGQGVVGALRISGCDLVAAAVGVIVVASPRSGVADANVSTGDPF